MDRRDRGIENSTVGETVETVLKILPHFYTGLKPGVNETRLLRQSHNDYDSSGVTSIVSLSVPLITNSDDLRPIRSSVKSLCKSSMPAVG